jgi:very-short-patch-repair endonuclease
MRAEAASGRVDVGDIGEPGGEGAARALDRARTVRRQHTPAEAQLWGRLRGRRFQGFKFVRQVPIGPYVVDFLCRSAGLVIEVDGATHSTDAEVAYDERRGVFLYAEGYRVLRVNNDDVHKRLDDVIETILAALEGRL